MIESVRLDILARGVRIGTERSGFRNQRFEGEQQRCAVSALFIHSEVMS